ncbi:hypothetical protein MRX96_003718 [Rhipicephalus microplus]
MGLRAAARHSSQEEGLRATRVSVAIASHLVARCVVDESSLRPRLVCSRRYIAGWEAEGDRGTTTQSAVSSPDEMPRRWILRRRRASGKEIHARTK